MSLFGDWGKIPGFFLLMNKRIIDAGNKGKHDLAVKTKKIWRDGIRTKSFNLEPLKSVTIRRKKVKSTGASGSTPLIWYKDMVNSINVEKVGGDWFAGINRNAMHRKSGKLMNIAMIHEYGSPKNNLPARPHRDKTIKEVQKIYDDTVMKPLFNALKKR